VGYLPQLWCFCGNAGCAGTQGRSVSFAYVEGESLIMGPCKVRPPAAAQPSGLDGSSLQRQQQRGSGMDYDMRQCGSGIGTACLLS